MVLIKEIELALKPADNEVRAQEDELLADSVLQLTSSDFVNTDEHESLAPGSIRKHVEADMRVAYPGKPTSRKRVFKDNFQESSKPKSEISKENKISPIKSIDQNSDEDLDDDDAEWKTGVSFENFESEDEKDSKEYENIENEFLVDSEPEEGSFESDGTGGSNSESEELGSQSDGTEGNDLDSNFDGSILGDNQLGDSPSEFEEEVKEAHEEPDDKIDLFSARARDIDADISKGRSIQNELSIWEKLIECRIKLQPCLISANKLYQKESFQEFKSSLNAEEQLLSETYSSLSNLMKGLLELQDNLINAVPAFKDMKAQKRKAVDERDYKLTKKRKSDIDLLKDIDEDFKPFRNETIQKWNEKTRVSSGKINKNDFSSFDLPTLKQIEEVLLDRDRLLKRTRIKRSDYVVLGKTTKTLAEEESITSEKSEEKHHGEYDPEIFDDDDFYHKLLRDFIEKKTSDVSNTSKKGKQWLELQKLRSKMKAKIDTRASKGRKLRFTVHNKMVNFMAPIPSYTWTDEAKNELFKSLFC